MLLPAPLKPGSVVRVIAPASPFDARLLWRGLGWLSERYRVRWERGIFARSGYLAGSDDRRRAELAAALTEPDVDAVLCARGGYGISRYAHLIDWHALRRAPRWLVGFSDVTALHVEACRVGVASLHACNVTGLGQGDAVRRAALVSALEAPSAPRRLDGLMMIHPGESVGPIIGDNLTLLHACAAAGRFELPPGCVLFIEDVTERPYRIDRMLTTLLVGGHLDRVAALVVGEFDRCTPAGDGVSVRHVIAELTAPLAIPVLWGAPVCHGRNNEPIIIGSSARVVAGPAAGYLELGR